MNDDVAGLCGGDPDLDQRTTVRRPEDHREVIHLEHPDRVGVGVEEIGLGQTVPQGAGSDDRLHTVNIC